MTLNINNNQEETICAISTAHGIGSISIVRVSGFNALDISYKLFKSSKKLIPRYATLKEIYDKNHDLIDTAIVIYFKSPKSFTAEDVVEFQCHGGISVASIILDTLIFYGARLAQNGEFSKRAFLNGKIDISQAEAIAKLIETKNTNAVKLLAKQVKGELSNFIKRIREELIYIIASCEVSIDYAEEELPTDLNNTINNKLNNVLELLKNTLESSQRREGLINGYKVAIIGKPNVGKSSLLNKLLSYNRAIVSDICGTTRDTIEEEIKMGTHIIKLVDTAGIRQTENKIEKIGIQKSLEATKEADIIIALFDISKKTTKEDLNILQHLNQLTNKHIIYVLNKSDLKEEFDYDLKQYKPIKISTKKSINILIDKINTILNNNNIQDDVLLISKRQINALINTIEELEQAFSLLQTQELELFSFHINEAITLISSISKPFEYDELLDQMFGNFCLGK